MPKDQSLLTRWGQFLALRGFATAMLCRDVRANLRTAAAFADSWYRLERWAERPGVGPTRPAHAAARRVLRNRRQRTLQHLIWAFPEMTDDQRSALANEAYRHLIQLAVEVMHTPRLIHTGGWHQRLKLKNLGPAIRMLNASEPALLITGHVGNWEVLGYLLATLGYRIDAIARPLDNPLINDWLLEIRERQGLRIITKFQATDRMLEVLSSGGTLGFIADQNAGPKGLFVPFFGRLASTYKSIGLLAISQNVPLICGCARRMGMDYRYELEVEDIIRPDDWADQPDPLYYVTARYVRALETMIRRSPQQYLWMHRRWKSRPRFEQDGKAMPKSLQRKLESLPWIDEPTMRQLHEPAPRTV